MKPNDYLNPEEIKVLVVLTIILLFVSLIMVVRMVWF